MPNVPIPPPLPPPSEPETPTGTMKRNMAINANIVGKFIIQLTEGGNVALILIPYYTAMRARTDFDDDDEALMRQSTINDELKFTLLQRERRRDLEILKTPQIYINQKSQPKAVEEWLRAKGFPDNIVKKLRGLNGEELFALSPHIIEGYFGQKESRRLISQIVLQKNICEVSIRQNLESLVGLPINRLLFSPSLQFKTVRSSELNAKLARARQKIESQNCDPNEVF